MKNSLLWRFVVIFSVMALAIVCVELFPLRPGIDLAGGTSLLYELDMEKAAASRSSPQELAQQVIAVLKQRVDPGGQMNLIWRVVGGKRIQVQMPLPSKETRNAKLALEKAEQAILDTSLKQSEVQSALSKTGAARDAAIAALAPPGNPRHDQLLKLAAAQDELAAVNAEAAKYAVGQTPTDLLGRKIAAQKAVAAAKSALEELNVDLATLKSVVTAADNPKNTEAQQALDAIVKNHTSQRQEIQTYIESHRKLMELNGGGVEDSADLQRMITSSGVLDFRITVNPMDVGYPDGELYQQALKSLKDNGPNSQMKLGGIVCRWFQVNPNWKDNFDRVGFVTGTWAGEPYVLCYDDATRALTHAEGRRPWSVQADRPYYDPTRGEIMPFHLDPIGARMMGDLTGDNIGRPMCILLADKESSAPTLTTSPSFTGRFDTMPASGERITASLSCFCAFTSRARASASAASSAGWRCRAWSRSRVARAPALTSVSVRSASRRAT